MHSFIHLLVAGLEFQEFRSSAVLDITDTKVRIEYRNINTLNNSVMFYLKFLHQAMRLKIDICRFSPVNEYYCRLQRRINKCIICDKKKHAISQPSPHTHTDTIHTTHTPLKLTRLGAGPAVDLRGVVAGVAAVGHKVVEEEAVGTLLLRVDAVAALGVAVAEVSVGEVGHAFFGAVLGGRCK